MLNQICRNPYMIFGLVMITCSLAGCGSDATPESISVVRDSAGVRIVENENGSVPEWHISPSPVVNIGSATDTLTGLYQVTGAHLLSDGQIVVSNRGTDEIRYFNPDGSHRKTVGRSGKGPGEFDYVAWTTRCGADTIYAYDIGTRRLTVLDDQGEVVRLGAMMLPENTLPYGRASCQPGGPFVSTGWAARDEVQGGYHRPDMPIGLMDLRGEPLTMIGEFPGVDRWGTVRDGQLRGTGPLPLGRVLLHAIANDRVYVGSGDSYQLSAYGLDGSLEMLVRLNVPPSPITEDDIDALIEDALEDIENAGRQASTRRYYRDIEYLAELPAFSEFVADAANGLWVRDYPRPRAMDVTWRRFASDGTYAAQTTMPAGLEVYEIGMDYVLGVSRDEFGIEHVQLFGFGESAAVPGGDRESATPLSKS